MEAGSLRGCSAPMILERTLAEEIQEDPSIASDQAKKDLSYAALSRGERVVQNLTILVFTQGQMFIWNGFTPLVLSYSLCYFTMYFLVFWGKFEEQKLYFW